MSGFVSKISAAGSKGWTGLQSLWDRDRDNKTPPTASPSGPPAEKTSLLSFSLPSRHPKGSRLLSEDDDWADTPPSADDDDDTQQHTADSRSSGATYSSSSTTIVTTTTHSLTPNAAAGTMSKSSPRSQPRVEKERAEAQQGEWSSVSEEDEADVWLKGDSAHWGILDTDKKKSTRESKRPSPRFKHKMTSSSSSSSSSKGGDWKQEKGGFSSALGKLKGPAFGKLLDVDCEEGEERGGSSSSAAGCDNKVWADDDDNAQWKMMDNR